MTMSVSGKRVRTALDADAGAPDGVERLVGERVAVGLVLVHPRLAAVPGEGDACGLEDAAGRLRELGPGAIPRDEGHVMGHCGFICS